MIKEEKSMPDYEPHVIDFLHNPVYVSVTSKTIKTAESAYQFARILSIILFSVGIALIVAAILFGVFSNNNILAIFFGGLGATNIITLFLYRPIERIQSGVDALIKSQIACISFAAQHDIVMRSISSSKNLDDAGRLKLAQYLRETTTQLIADLDGRLQEQKRPGADADDGESLKR